MIYILGASAMAKETLNIYKRLSRLKEIGGFIEENKGFKARDMRAEGLYQSYQTNLLFGGGCNCLRKFWSR